MRIAGASLNAAHHDYLMLWINIITISAFVLVNSVLIYFIIRYRRRTDNDLTSSVDNHLLLEILWTLIPTIIMAGLCVWGIRGFIDYRSDVANAMEIQVRAKQWAWSFTYPKEVLADNPKENIVVKTSNVLYLEANRPTKLIMKSSDVIHSFFVPAFRVKEDVVPNIYTFINFTPIFRKGQNNRAEYDIFCTEYCGRDHSGMLGKAVVLNTENFSEEINRIAEEASDITAERGKTIHLSQCYSCHSIDGSRLVGPSWLKTWGITRKLADGTEVKIDENYIRTSILDPNLQIAEGYPGVMPVQDLNDAEIESVIEYIKTLD